MSTYTIGVVAHTSRAAQVEALENTINPDVIGLDDGTLGVGANHLRVLKELTHTARRTGQEWVVVLEDDAQPVVPFHRELNAALDAAPSPIVSLYNGTGYPAQYQRRFAEAVGTRVPWIKHAHLRHAVAYAIEKPIFELGLIESLEQYVALHWAPDDAISAWARRSGIPVAYSNPSLVDHEDGPPTIGQRRHLGRPTFGRKRPRKAHWVGTRESWWGESATV